MATRDGTAPGTDWEVSKAPLGRHFQRDMEGLWENVLKLAAVVETALHTSIQALCDGRADLAAQVKGGENAINDWEVRIERDCLKVLALHQPVASDLRRVAAILKINGDLERIADLADHIANRARKLAVKIPPVPIPPKMEAMAREAMNQIHDSLDSLVKGDVLLARNVIAADRGVDRLRRAVLKELKDCIRQEPDRVNTWLRLINTARNIERVADHATNIAEAVIYLKEGDIIRHVGDRRVATG